MRLKKCPDSRRGIFLEEDSFSISQSFCSFDVFNFLWSQRTEYCKVLIYMGWLLAKLIFYDLLLIFQALI